MQDLLVAGAHLRLGVRREEQRGEISWGPRNTRNTRKLKENELFRLLRLFAATSSVANRLILLFGRGGQRFARVALLSARAVVPLRRATRYFSRIVGWVEQVLLLSMHPLLLFVRTTRQLMQMTELFRQVWLLFARVVPQPMLVIVKEMRVVVQ